MSKFKVGDRVIAKTTCSPQEYNEDEVLYNWNKWVEEHGK